MLRLRLAVMGFLVVLLAAGGLQGQDKKAPEKDPPVPKGKGTLPTYFKKLGLTDAQTQKVYKIHTSYKTKIDALQQQINELRKEEKTELDKVLSDEQKTRLRELRLGETDAPKEKDPPAKDKEPAKDKGNDK